MTKKTVLLMMLGSALLTRGYIIVTAPKRINNSPLNIRKSVCLHSDTLTEFGLCEFCGDIIE